jgi:hypothetical protein
MRRMIRVGLAGLMAAGILGGVSSSAFAADGDVIKEGSCSMASDWKLKVGPEDGQLDGEWEIDSNVVGQTWSFKIKKDGVVIKKGTAVTKAPSGSFEINFLTPNPAGSTKFVATAANAATGESCKGTLTFNG